MQDTTLQKVATVCPLDCPDACALQVSVQDGTLIKVSGQPDHPNTRGFACVKMHQYPKRQHHPDRLLYPMKRTGKKGEGAFTRITWDEALETISNHLQKTIQAYGGQTILPYSYAGTMGLIEHNHGSALFRALGANELDKTICSAAGKAAWEVNYGPGPLGTDPEDVPHARFIILWGIDVMRSNVHLVPKLKEAKKNGAFILHIDPYCNETSHALADEHWQITPGTDTALALAMGNIILTEGLEDTTYLQAHASGLQAYREMSSQWTLEQAATYCGLDATRIHTITQQYARTPASYIRVGYGLTRNESGGNAMRAISLLPALTGAWQHQGGGGHLSTGGGYALNTSRLGAAHLLTGTERHINMSQLASGLAVTDPPIKALVVFNSNPAAIAPDSARVRAQLAREDLFTVVLEHFQTDTADYADILLPSTTFLEHPDLYISYGHYFLHWAEPVLDATGECRSNTDVFKALGRRLGVTEESLYWSSEQVVEALLDTPHPNLRGICLERLKQERYIKLNVPEAYRPYSQGSQHKDGKIHFSPPPEQRTFEDQPNKTYPLRLISPPGKHMVNTSMGNLPALLKASGGEPQMVLSPQDAERYGIVAGKRYHITSTQGSIVRQVQISTDAKEGTLVALGQWWPKLAPDGKSLNDLTSERLTDIGGGSTFGNNLVRIGPEAQLIH